MSSKSLSGPYSISRDLVREGYLFTLKLYGAQLASHKWAFPYPPDWMLDKEMRGNAAALEGTLHSQVMDVNYTITHTEDKPGFCQAPTGG